MDIGFITVLAFGFFLGLKHAIEPDHVIAVTTIASRSKNIFNASLAGLFWGIGHTATIFVVSILFILLKTTIPEAVAQWLEFLVGVMIVFLGVSVIAKKGKPSNHHEATVNASSKFKSLIIGIIHGLAGSGAMILLTASTVDSLPMAVVYLLIFGLGTATGMVLFTMIISLPFVLSKYRTLNRRLVQLTGVLGVSFGVFYMTSSFI
ncbi:HoxN/HupN/NixA family nickel/cobalt transporter [Tuberibacillus sp. Marseille-P3662]|uniref:HoxN/HupN/NixA family nickel/cobalt transporter n=1 Tax=Tuberibacillus sp. Marseille-P3662 TaxID=1965358 RepID=UPI000A1C8249|nr:sulfite exporter TauE/SafE family protein [Tuberibacillus sp. Marseille-P3662]